MGALDRLANYSSANRFTPKKFIPSGSPAKIVTPHEQYCTLVNKLGFETKDAQGNESQLGFILGSEGNLEVNAIAGSGKTTALSLKIIRDLFCGTILTDTSLPNGTVIKVVDKTWVCTFLRTGASDLEGTVDVWQKELHMMPRTAQITFSTLDAEFLHTLEGMGAKVSIGKEDKLYICFKKAVDLAGITKLSGEPLDNEDYRILETIIKSVRGRLDNTKYDHPSCTDYGLVPKNIDDIITNYSNFKKAQCINDFEDIQELLYKYLYVTPNPAVQDYVANKYNNIYIDEFQDTSQIQYALLKFYARNSLWLNRDGKEHDTPLYHPADHETKIVVVGDVSQCIYSFKGSDSRILATYFDEDFRPIVADLSCNWRCPDNILNPVIPSIHLNADSANQKIYSAKQGGEFGVYGMANMQQMLARLMIDVKADVERGMNVAILCRTNYDGFLPALTLEMAGCFDYSISGESMTFKSAISKKLLGISNIFTERSTPAVKSALELVVPFTLKFQVVQLLDVLKNNSKSIWDIDDDDLKMSASAIFEFVKKFKPIFVTNGVRDKQKEVEALKAVFQYLKTNVYKSNTAWCEQARAILTLYIYVLSSHSYNNVNEFLDEMDYVADRMNGRVKKSKMPVTIATVHEFKGKEADSIIVWNDSDGVFPSRKCDVNNEAQLAEERRVHYIACTRARKCERIYTQLGNHSIFVNEMDYGKEIMPISAPTSKQLGVQNVQGTI